MLLLLASTFVALNSSPTSAVDPLTWLIYNAGALGVVFALLVTGQLRTKAEVTHLISEIASKDKVIEAFQAQLTGHTLPALAQSARILEAIPGSETVLLLELGKSRAETADLAKRLDALRAARGIEGT